MKYDEILSFVRANVEPLPAFDPHPERYRVSASLTDGTFLPCVVIEDRRPTVSLALKRFEETKESNDRFMGHRAIVSSFVTKGNRINDYEVRELRSSDYAIPLARMREISGETCMSWTQFYATMSDGEEFCFGTHFSTEFFDMPGGYKATDIVRIRPAPRGTRPAPTEIVFRERLYFTCYIGNS